MKQWQIFLMLGFFLLVLSSFDSAEGEASGVTIASDRLSADILLDEMAVITLTIEEGDERYRKQEIYLMAVWPDDIAWETAFVDTNYDEIEDNTRSRWKWANVLLPSLIIGGLGMFRS